MAKWSKFTGALLALLIGFPAGAYADSDPTDYQLKPITITAQKRGENIQEAPTSVNAFSEIELDEHHIEKFHDLINYVPNLSIRKNGPENKIVIRGISSFAGGMTSSTGFYVDGMNYPLHQMQDLDFIDLERVEVLKGPQGTLYGRNSEAGVINVITKQPTNELEAKIVTGIGMWDGKDLNPIYKGGFALNFPVSENTLAMRLTGQIESSDGWMEDTLKDEPANKIEHLTGRAITRWTPSDDTTVSLTLEARDKSDGVAEYRFVSGDYATKRNTMQWDGANRNNVNTDMELLKIEHDMGDFEITSLTGRQGYLQRFSNDMDMTPQPFGNSGGEYDVTIYSQELRFNSPKEEGRAIDWLAGLYGYSEDIDTIYEAGMVHDTKQDNWGAAAFGQATWNITSAWHLTGGLRLDSTSLSGKQDYTNGADVQHFKKDLNYLELLPTATLAYDITDDIMSYAKVAKGYLAGGFDYSTAETQEQFSYDPEYSWTYEIGVKSTLLDKKMTANVALFFIDVQDKQVAQMEPTAGNPEARKIVNAAKVQSYGAELEIKYQPIKPLTLSSSLGYLRSEMKDWETAGADPFNYDGKTTPGAPEWSYAVGATYRWESGFLAGADVVGSSSYFTDTKNLQNNNARTLVNTRLGYESEKYDVILWAKNVFDEDYTENKWDWGGPTLIQQGAPRSFGLELTARF